MTANNLLRKSLILLLSLFAFVPFSLAQEPTTINVKTNGDVNWIHYDLSQHNSVRPLKAIYITGEGNVEYLRFEIDGYSFLMNEYGDLVGNMVAPFDIIYDWDDKIDKFKKGWTTVLDFDYDFDGRLTKVKNGSFTTLMRLKYDFDGRLTGIDKGNFNYLVRFYYNFDDQIDKIKNGSYATIYDFRYDFNDRLEGIKNSSFNWIAKVGYLNGTARNIANYSSKANIIIGNYDVASFANPFSGFSGGGYGGGYDDGHLGHNSHCGSASQQVEFFEHSNQSGLVLNYSIGNYGSIPHNWNDKISSLRVPNGLKVIVFEHSNFGGAFKTITGNWTVHTWNEFWNDRISSFKIMNV